jgi:hypothetical protein
MILIVPARFVPSMPVHHRVSGGKASRASIRSFSHAQTAAVLLMVIVIVIASLIGLGSAWLRERVI